MRNLKKVLSLTLALVMMLGMMVVGAGAAEYADSGDIDDKYAEAVSVMSAEGVKILNGKDDGNFDPQGTLKRSEAAKIITVMLLGESTANAIQATSSSGTFTDVAADYWASGVIEYCANQGIIKGTSDTTFEPESQLTGTQFAAMILRALGIEGEFTGPQWEINVVAAANKAKLVDKITLNNTPISREAAAQLGFNGLKYSPSGEKSYVVNGQSYDSFIEAYIASGNDATKITVTTARDSLAKTVFGLTEDTKTDAFGRTVRTWSVGDDEVFVANVAETAAVKVYTKKTGESTIDKDLKGYKFADDAVKYVDGVESDVSGTVKTVLNGLTEDGASVEVYASNKVISKVVKVRDYVDAVTAVTPARGDKARTITVGGMTFETESFEKGDVVVYNKANNKIASVVLAETVESVKVTSAKLDADHVTSFSVDGTDYNFSAVKVTGNKDDANLNNIVTLYLDSHGFVGKVEKVEGTTANAYVLDIGHKSAVYGSDATYYAKLLLTDGSVVSQAELHKDNIDAAKATTNSGGAHPSAPADIVAVLKGTTTGADYDAASHTAQLMGKIVSFTETDDVYKLTAKSAALGNYVTNSGTSDGKVEVTNGKSAMTLGDGTLYANSNTIFLVKTGTNSYTSYTGFNEVPNLKHTTATDTTKNGKFAYDATSNVVSVIYLEGVQTETSDVVFLLAAGCDTKATKDSAGTYYNCAAVVNGEITSVKLKAKLPENGNKLLKSVVQDKNGIIDWDASTGVASDDYKAGTVGKALEDGVLKIVSTSYVVAEDATAFVCGDDIQGSDVSAILKDDTVIFAVLKDGQITTVFYSEKAEGDQGEQGGNGETQTGATVNPTGATIDEDAARIAVDFVHGGKSADRIAQEKLVASGWKIVSGSLNTTAKTVSATKEDGIEVEFTYIPTEYFTVKVDSTTYYVDDDGHAKGEDDVFVLPLNKSAEGFTGTGTGFTKSTDGAAASYAAYVTSNTGAQVIKIAGNNSNVDGNYVINTGYVEVTYSTSDGADVTGGVQKDKVGTATGAGYVKSGETLTVTVEIGAASSSGAAASSYVTLANSTVNADSEITGAEKTVTAAQCDAGVSLTWTVKAGTKDIALKATLSDTTAG